MKPQNDASRARRRARAQTRLPVEMRQQLLDAIYAGQPFRTILRDLGLTSNQVFGLTNRLGMVREVGYSLNRSSSG
jgi:hypothetical protein